ncbi:hypothetical protein SISSUDRAFT_1052226 [Sistotremastrum suecicum HHB10207 ss-3]|uniref:Uncharacterized protein n=1 Tax=Sistotremastrum suecicum HHB10207 ss-3 TaxID=1314776 RepID=A0A166A1G7_9AGAM|nr:hypothetical protein SISSUDRAFT_1052226 [Sistotremastrum suecicum HHB10207 ss-3]
MSDSWGALDTDGALDAEGAIWMGQCWKTLQIRLGIASATYGFMVMLALVTHWTFIARYWKHHSFKIIMTMLILTFTLATLEFGLTITNITRSFIPAVPLPTSEALMSGTFQCTNSPTTRPMEIIVELQMLLGDCFAIYRCWLVWGKRWLVVLVPNLLAVLLFVTIPLLAMRTLNDVGLFLPIAISLVLNILTTVLIIIRLWKARSNLIQANLIKPAVWFIIQTGLMYHVTLLFLFIGLFAGWADVLPMIGPNLITSIIAIEFHSLVLQVTLSKTLHHLGEDNTPAADEEFAMREENPKQPQIVWGDGESVQGGCGGLTRRRDDGQALTYDPVVDLILTRRAV